MPQWKKLKTIKLINKLFKSQTPTLNGHICNKNNMCLYLIHCLVFLRLLNLKVREEFRMNMLVRDLYCSFHHACLSGMGNSQFFILTAAAITQKVSVSWLRKFEWGLSVNLTFFKKKKKISMHLATKQFKVHMELDGNVQCLSYSSNTLRHYSHRVRGTEIGNLHLSHTNSESL